MALLDYRLISRLVLGLSGFRRLGMILFYASQDPTSDIAEIAPWNDSFILRKEIQKTYMRWYEKRI